MGAFTNLFGSYPRVAVAEAFSENPDEELSVPDIVKITGKSKRAVYMHVKKLLGEGILSASSRVGKCQYYRFNENDPRGEALTYLENILVLGGIEKRIKEDYDISLDQEFPFPGIFDPKLRPVTFALRKTLPPGLPRDFIEAAGLLWAPHVTVSPAKEPPPPVSQATAIMVSWTQPERSDIRIGTPMELGGST